MPDMLKSEAQNQAPPRENMVGQLWRYATALVPPWLIVTGGVAFGAVHAWQSYLEAQNHAVEIHLKTAKAAVEQAKAEAANTPVGDVSARLATLRAEVDKKQQEAARLKTELDAQGTQIGDATLQTQSLRAQVAQKQAEAAKARVIAIAATEREGLQTLEEKAASAQLEKTELDAIGKNVGGMITKLTEPGGKRLVIDALCGNAYAALIGCPESYVQKYRPFRQVAPAGPETPPPPSSEAPGEHYGRVLTTALKVRNCAEFSRRCPETWRARQGDRMKIIRGAANGWLQVQSSAGAVGFVNGKFLAME